MADVENNSSSSRPSSAAKTNNDNILYDLSVLAEWKLENEIFVRSFIY